jgi:glycosidase
MKFSISYVHHLLLLQELARENSPRDRENAMEALRKSTNPNEKTSPNNTSITNSREGSRTTSPESSVPEQTLPTNKTTTTTTNVSTSFDEEKTQTRVHSLIEEYTENYSDSNDRSVNVSHNRK